MLDDGMKVTPPRPVEPPRPETEVKPPAATNTPSEAPPPSTVRPAELRNEGAYRSFTLNRSFDQQTQTTPVGDTQPLGADTSPATTPLFFGPPTDGAPPTPTEALGEINSLPIPDPDDAAAVAGYNGQRSQIADAAIQNAVPPDRDDFSGLNPRTAAMEYSDAKNYHDSQIAQLTAISEQAKAEPNTLPRDVQLPDETIDINQPAQAQAIADEAQAMITAAGGVDNLNTEQLGTALADIAQTDPARARALATALFGEQIDTEGSGVVKNEQKDQVFEAVINDLSDDDLHRIGNTENGRAFLQKAQQHLLAGNPDEGNERAVADRIQQQGLLPHTTLSDTYNGVYDPVGEVPVSTRYDLEASPEDVARAISNPENPQGRLDSFAAQLDAHQGDADWLQRFYSSLGREQVGQLLSQSVNSNTYRPLGNAGNPEVMRQNVDAIRGSLETLYASGRLSQEDLNVLVKNVDDNPHVALEIFGKSGNEALRDAFTKAAASSGGDATKAAVVTMISGQPADQQAEMLGSLSQEELNSLFTGAMRAKGEIADLTSDIERYSYDPASKMTTIGDVTPLIGSAAGDTLSPEVKQKLFIATSQALTDDKVNDNYKDNDALRVHLGQIFIDETQKPGSENLLTRLASDANGSLSGDEKSALSGFFAFTAFSGRQVSNSLPLEAQVRQVFLDAGTGLTDGDLTANSLDELNAAQRGFRDEYGLDPKQYATMVGGLLESAEDGLGIVQRRASEDEAERKEAITFFVDLAASLVPGVSGIAAKGVTNGVLNQLVDKTTGAVESEVRSKLSEQAVGLIENLFDMSGSGLLSEDDLSTIYDGFEETLPNQVNNSDGTFGIDILDGFDAGYGNN